MARPQKKTVDYFPHYVAGSKKTLFILESKFGIQGYYFWFHLLELLALSEGHYYNFNNVTDAEYLFSYTKTDSETAENILNVLASLEAIDKELWEQNIIWSQNFVDGIKDAYKKRVDQFPQKPSLSTFKPNKNIVSGDGNPTETTNKETETGKVKESKEKEKEIKEEEIKEECTEQAELVEIFTPDLTQTERECLNTLKKTPNYPYDYKKDLQLTRDLSIEFPEVNLLEELKKWAHRKKYDDPLKKDSKPRGQIRNWLTKAKEFNKGQARGPTQTKKDKFKLLYMG